MKRIRFDGWLALWMIMGFLAVPAIAEDKKGDPPKKEEAKKDDAVKKADSGKSDPASMDAEQEAWMKAAQPGKEHEIFKGMVGSWNHVARFRMAPDQEWQESKGTTERRLIMGGRYLQQETKSPPMMEGSPPFEGLGLTGFDNIMKKYVNTWLDNEGTGIMVSYGTADASGKVITYTSESLDPTSGEMAKFKSVVRLKDGTGDVYEMYAPGPDGKEFMMLEVTYAKK